MEARCIVAIFVVMGLVFATVSLAQAPSRPASPPEELSSAHTVTLPKEGFVPDRETAIKIAEVVLFRLLGERTIVNQRPYIVKEDDGIWWISGTVREGEFGVAFKIGISKHTAAIVHLSAS